MEAGRSREWWATEVRKIEQARQAWEQAREKVRVTRAAWEKEWKWAWKQARQEAERTRNAYKPVEQVGPEAWTAWTKGKATRMLLSTKVGKRLYGEVRRAREAEQVARRALEQAREKARPHPRAWIDSLDRVYMKEVRTRRGRSVDWTTGKPR